jgi:hypothetical protein
MISETMNAILDSLSISKQITVTVSNPSQRVRREFRGDRNSVVVDPSLTYAWLPSFEAFSAKNTRQCEYVFTKYEAQVNKFEHAVHPHCLTSQVWLQSA